ncbi:C2H2-type zinc finger protein ASCRUDRAFT_40106, partial [Ascoidea rubescens DSM 1968]
NNNNNTFTCDKCQKSFSRAYNLKSHQKTHSNEKPFPCKICGRPFARQHDRKRHEFLHQGIRNYKCGGYLKDNVTKWGCGRKFARSDALGRHFRTETGWLCIRPLLIESKQQEDYLKRQYQLNLNNHQIQNINMINNNNNNNLNSNLLPNLNTFDNQQSTSATGSNLNPNLFNNMNNSIMNNLYSGINFNEFDDPNSTNEMVITDLLKKASDFEESS